MVMGSTGIVNMTPEMMNNALKVVESYRTQATSLYNQLETTMADLIPGNFSGAAADGFRIFYDNNIEPAAGESLTKLLDAMKQIFEETLKAIPGVEGLDDQLAEGNKQ